MLNCVIIPPHAGDGVRAVAVGHDRQSKSLWYAGELVLDGHRLNPGWSFCALQLFLPTLHELDVHATGGMDWFVNLRSTMLDDPSGLAPFVETWTSEKLAFAETGVVHSYEALPPVKAWEELMKEYMKWAERR